MSHEITIRADQPYAPQFGALDAASGEAEWGSFLVRVMAMAEAACGEEIVSVAHSMWALKYADTVREFGWDIARDEWIERG